MDVKRWGEPMVRGWCGILCGGSQARGSCEVTAYLAEQ